MQERKINNDNLDMKSQQLIVYELISSNMCFDI